MIEKDFSATGFNTREAKSNFINPRCFGEDVADALRDAAAKAAPELQVGDPTQEDFGWGFRITADGHRFWAVVSLADQARWKLVADHDPGLNLWDRFLRKPGPQTVQHLDTVLSAAIRQLPGGNLLPDVR